MAFEESKHPRDKNGQFTSKGGGSATSGNTKEETSKSKKEYSMEQKNDNKYSVYPDFNFVSTIDETDYDKVEKNEKINAGKGKNPNRKDKYGNELVSDEAFIVGQKGVKAYLDYMLKYNNIESLKHSRVFMNGLQRAVSKSIEEAGYDPNYDVTYQDMDEIIGSVLGEEVDTAGAESGTTIGFKHKQYTGYQPKTETTEIDEDYERSWGPANDEEIEQIEIDGDYERSWGPAPDPEDDPEEYKKYIKDYKKWLKNGESWDGLDGLKEEDEEKERKQAYKLFNLPF